MGAARGSVASPGVTGVAFLRAVNVGRRRVTMARVAEIVRDLGPDGVWTFLNSGNVVFHGGGGRRAMEQMIGSALEAEYGFEVTTFVRTVDELRAVLAVQPFEVLPADTYVVTFLAAAPSAEVARRLTEASNDVDTLVVHGTEVHWRIRGRSQDTTVSPATWKLVGTHGSTSRNITMVRKLITKIDVG